MNLGVFKNKIREKLKTNMTKIPEDHEILQVVILAPNLTKFQMRPSQHMRCDHPTTIQCFLKLLFKLLNFDFHGHRMEHICYNIHKVLNFQFLLYNIP